MMLISAGRVCLIFGICFAKVVLGLHPEEVPWAAQLSVQTRVLLQPGAQWHSLPGGLPCFVNTSEGKLAAGIPGKEHKLVSCRQHWF